jgi:hypothetical protein
MGKFFLYQFADSCPLHFVQHVIFQVVGKVPLIALDKTDGAQIYISPESLNCEIGMLPFT